MNKFSMLQFELEKIIASLTEQIKTKNENIDALNSANYKNEIKLNALKRKLQHLNQKQKVKSEIEDKSTLLCALKMNIDEIRKERKLNPTRLFTLLILDILFLLAILVAIFVYQSPLGIYLLLFDIGAHFICIPFPAILKFNKLKKGLSVKNIEEEIVEVERNIEFLNDKIRNDEAKLAILGEKIQALQQEKAYYEQALSEVTESRDQAIEQQADDILNAAFEKKGFSDIIRKVREKKEGENNG